MSSATALLKVSRLEERCAHFKLAAVTFSPTTLNMVQSGMRCLRSCAASRDSCCFYLHHGGCPGILCAPKRCQPRGLGIGTQFLIARDSCRSCSNPGKKQVSSDWSSFSTQVGTGIGSAGSEIRWTLATSGKLESSPRNRRVGAGYRIDLRRSRWKHVREGMWRF